MTGRAGHARGRARGALPEDARGERPDGAQGSFRRDNEGDGQYGQRAAAFNARVLRTPREEIVHGLRRIAQVDNAIKGSEATPRLQMEYLIAELTLPESARWGIFYGY